MTFFKKILGSAIVGLSAINPSFADESPRDQEIEQIILEKSAETQDENTEEESSSTILSSLEYDGGMNQAKLMFSNEDILIGGRIELDEYFDYTASEIAIARGNFLVLVGHSSYSHGQRDMVYLTGGYITEKIDFWKIFNTQHQISGGVIYAPNLDYQTPYPIVNSISENFFDGDKLPSAIVLGLNLDSTILEINFKIGSVDLKWDLYNQLLGIASIEGLFSKKIRKANKVGQEGAINIVDAGLSLSTKWTYGSSLSARLPLHKQIDLLGQFITQKIHYDLNTSPLGTLKGVPVEFTTRIGYSLHSNNFSAQLMGQYRFGSTTFENPNGFAILPEINWNVNNKINVYAGGAYYFNPSNKDLDYIIGDQDYSFVRAGIRAQVSENTLLHFEVRYNTDYGAGLISNEDLTFAGGINISFGGTSRNNHLDRAELNKYFDRNNFGPHVRYQEKRFQGTALNIPGNYNSQNGSVVQANSTLDGAAIGTSPDEVIDNATNLASSVELGPGNQGITPPRTAAETLANRTGDIISQEATIVGAEILSRSDQFHRAYAIGMYNRLFAGTNFAGVDNSGKVHLGESHFGGFDLPYTGNTLLEAYERNGYNPTTSFYVFDIDPSSTAQDQMINFTSHARKVIFQARGPTARYFDYIFEQKARSKYRISRE